LFHHWIVAAAAAAAAFVWFVDECRCGVSSLYISVFVVSVPLHLSFYFFCEATIRRLSACCRGVFAVPEVELYIFGFLRKILEVTTHGGRENKQKRHV
jgi:peptidoglycan/LPS O-acetylase OafA/YrhL